MKKYILTAVLALALLLGGTGSAMATTADTASTGAVSPESHQAVLKGSYSVNNNEVIAPAQFDFGTTTAYGTTYSIPAPCPADGSINMTNCGPYASLVMSGSFTRLLTNLACNTTYHYKFEYTVVGGAHVSGSDASFTTQACQLPILPDDQYPLASFPMVGSIGLHSANLAISTDLPNYGSTDDSHIVLPGSAEGFDYGTTTAYGSTLNVTATSATLSGTLTGLACATAYHVRAWATNAAGTGHSTDQTFTTLPCVNAFGVGTLAPSGASLVVKTTMNGQLTGVGETPAPYYTVGFNWGTTAAYGNTAPLPVVTNPSPLPYNFSVNLVDWGYILPACGQTFHYQAFAKTSTGTTVVGGDKTFSTGICSSDIAPGTSTSATAASTATTSTASVAVSVTSSAGGTCSLNLGSSMFSGMGTGSSCTVTSNNAKIMSVANFFATSFH